MRERVYRSLLPQLLVPIALFVFSIWGLINTYSGEQEHSQGLVRSLDCEVRQAQGPEYYWLIVNVGYPDAFSFRFRNSCGSLTTTAYLGLEYERWGRSRILDDSHMTERVMIGNREFLSNEYGKRGSVSMFLLFGLCSLVFGGAFTKGWLEREKALPNQ